MPADLTPERVARSAGWTPWRPTQDTGLWRAPGVVETRPLPPLRELILSLEPGPELDALCCEAVLGWEWRRSSETGCRALYPRHDAPSWMRGLADGSEPLAQSWDVAVDNMRVSKYPDAALSLLAALEQREPRWLARLTRRGSYREERPTWTGPPLAWEAWLLTAQDREVVVYRPTLPHAIALASLLAVVE